MVTPRAARLAGFTLIELMVVVTVLGILSALAAPSMTRLIAAQRVRSIASDLHIALVKARSEAIKRNAAVTIAPTAGDWNAGWSVLDPEDPDAPPLQAHAPAAGVSIATDVAQIVFQGSGRPAPSAEAAFLVSAAGSELARCVQVTLTGRPQVKEESAC